MQPGLSQTLVQWLPSAVTSFLVGALILLLIDHYKNNYLFWKRHNIKGDQPLVPIVWDLWNYFAKDQMQLCLDRTKKYGKIYGSSFMGRKRLFINDPEVVKQIAVKDFDLITDHTVNEWSNRYLRQSLVWIKGDHWRRVRAMMSPSFTSGKIKRMFKLMQGCADDLVDSFREQYITARRDRKQFAEIDLTETFGLYTMDGITTCCYGIKLKRQQMLGQPLGRASESLDASSRDSLVKDLNKMVRITPLRILALVLVPKFILRRLKFTLVSEAAVKPVVDRVQKMIDQRRNTERKYDDLLQLLVDAKLDDKVELNEMDQAENHHAGLTREELEEDQNKLQQSLKDNLRAKADLSDFEILSQAMLLLGAGLETTRSSLTSAAYFLAHNQRVQDRLYEELKSIAIYQPTETGKQLVFDYDSLTSCQYLDAVVSESLRLFPPAFGTDRYASQEYKIEKYNVTVPADVQIIFAIYSIHMDPDYWEEPTKFDPDRFMPGRKEKIVPGSYLPFSMGPRHCIGMRFSLTESKLALAKVLMHFKLEPAPGTIYPPKSVRSPGLTTIKDARVRIRLRDD